MLRQSYFTPTAALTALLLICGCSSHEVLPSSGTRAPSNPEQVELYQKHPKKYEQLGVVSIPITPEVRFNERGESVRGIDMLKAEAAKRGANGLLLVAEGAGNDSLVTVGYHGTFYQVPVRSNPRTAMAQAIYVIQK